MIEKFGFAKIEKDENLFWYINSVKFMRKKWRFEEDGFYLMNLAGLGSRKSSFEKIKIVDSNDILPFLNDLKKLKPYEI